MMTSPQPILRVDDIRLREAGGVGLMARAGAAAAVLAARLASGSGPVLVLCGPGNNGGDGFVLARHLMDAGRAVCVVFRGEAARLPADALAALEAYRAAGGQTVDALPARSDWSLAVDALFGIGLARAIGAPYDEWIAAFNALPCPRLAIDIPSGLDADTGAVRGATVRATHTLTFIALKPGLLTLDGPDYAGQISVDALGLDAMQARGFVNAPSQFVGALPARARNSHKGRFGNAGLVGGAAGMVGAALMSGRAALFGGAGRVFVGCLDGTLSVDPMQPELMLRAPREVIALADVLGVGPGLSQSAAALSILQAAIAGDKPLVLDADALNLIAAHPVLAGKLAKRSVATLLTPHPAEAARLLGVSTDDVQRDRVRTACTLAAKLNAQVVLKGCGSVIAQPSGRWWINPTGNPGMASGGMGDVLTGLAVALLAQGVPPDAALRAAVWLHGAAADACVAAGAGPVGLSASEIIPRLRAALNDCIGAQP